LSPEAIAVLRAYHWPGNVRELSNLIERLAVLHPRSTVSAADLPQRYRAGVPSVATAPVPAPVLLPGPDLAMPARRSGTPDAVLPPDGVNLKDHIEGIELQLIKQALAQSNGVVAHAAKLLNTRRTTLVEKLRKYGLTREAAGEEGEGLVSPTSSEV
jgi:sigma-54 specific flagellar transcriptional regulator A